MTTIDRFTSFVSPEPNTGCHLWMGAVYKRYGRFRLNGKNCMAHRAAYELYTGPIDAGMTVDHLCGQTICVNPSHLKLATLRENIRRDNRHSAKTHCISGHPYSPENTYVNRKGKRICRACARLRDQIRWRAKCGR